MVPFLYAIALKTYSKLWKKNTPFLIGKIDIFRDISQYCYDFNRVSFQFKGFEDIPLMTFSTDTEMHNITGGRAEMYIEEIVISQEHSKNLFWEQIPPEYLSVGDVEGLVQVKTKGLESACPKLDCTFSYAATAPEITDFDYDTGSRLLNIRGTNFDRRTIESIEFGGEPCESMSKTSTEVNCTLPNSPVGGVYQPEVIYEEGVWMLPAKTITIDYTITSVTPSTLNPSGGQLLTITGSGFPKTLEAGKEILAVLALTQGVVHFFLALIQRSLLSPPSWLPHLCSKWPLRETSRSLLLFQWIPLVFHHSLLSPLLLDLEYFMKN